MCTGSHRSPILGRQEETLTEWLRRGRPQRRTMSNHRSKVEASADVAGSLAFLPSAASWRIRRLRQPGLADRMEGVEAWLDDVMHAQETSEVWGVAGTSWTSYDMAADWITARDWTGAGWLAASLTPPRGSLSITKPASCWLHFFDKTKKT
jgi:hypothetical protein